MTREQTIEAIRVMQAYVDGKEVKCKYPYGWDKVALGAAYEIEKLQERIKQLEDARTVAAANSLANMLAYEDAVAKIKRLEEAGDALCTTMLRESKYLHGENFKASINVWRKAKEAKP